MRNLLLILLLLPFLAVAETPKKTTPKPAETKPVPPKEDNSTNNLPIVRKGVQVQWYGHAFVYFTSTSGVRIAIDPFGESVKIPFPSQLPADVVLVSQETDDRSAGEKFIGSPQIFRGITGVGANRGSGILIRGVGVFRDATGGKKLGTSTAYVFELDGVRFCHLGGIASVLNSRQADEIGRVDVLFLPIGDYLVTENELNDMTVKLGAKWIVPIAYQNKAAGTDELRSLDEFAKTWKEQRVEKTNSFEFSTSNLPQTPTLLILKSP